MIDKLTNTQSNPAADLIQLFRVDCADRGLTEHTVHMYTAYAEHFIEYLREREVDVFAVDRNTLRFYLNDLRTKS